MIRILRSIFLSIILGLPVIVAADDLNLPKGFVCWPLHFAGITLGVSTDSQVQRLLGPGVFRSNEGDAGGRYYIDKEAKATMHVVSYTYAVVGELTLTEGVSSVISANERAAAVSPWFDLKEGFGNWHALNLGSSKDDVLENLGSPEEELSNDEWQYSSRCACELPEYFVLSFKNNRVYKITLSAPAG